MIPDLFASQQYDRHVKHLDIDAKYLGDAESLEEIAAMIKKDRPNVYMLAKSCIDSSPTLQLANWQKVRRMGLKRFNREERSQLIELLDNKGIRYKQTRYLALNPDFSETPECKRQEKYAFFYRMSAEIKIALLDLVKKRK